MAADGLLVTSWTTRLIPLISLMMRRDGSQETLSI